LLNSNRGVVPGATGAMAIGNHHSAPGTQA